MLDLYEITAEEAATAPIIEVETTTELGSGNVVLDIYSQDEQECRTLTLDNVALQTLLFYKLGSQFGNPDQSESYLLYSNRWVKRR